MRRGPKRIEIPGKKWNEKFIHEKKTWHVVHKQDGITFAVCELRPGVVGEHLIDAANTSRKLKS